jgi:hypothetical protein
MTNIILIGRNQWVIDAAQRELTRPDRQVFGATNAEELKAVLTEHDIDHAFVGPGLDLSTRLDLIEQVFTVSDFTTVHLKDFSAGPEGALAFVEAILDGLATLPDRDG